MELFSMDATMFKKKFYRFFFDLENMKKPPSKVAHNRPRPFFSVQPIGPNLTSCSIKMNFLCRCHRNKRKYNS